MRGRCIALSHAQYCNLRETILGKLTKKINIVKKWRSNTHSRLGWVFLKQMWVLIGIQFTRHFIEFVVVKTKELIGSNVYVNLTWQTCGQRSCICALDKHRALACYFSVRICCLFRIPKCRQSKSVHNFGTLKKMRLRGADFRLKNVLGREIRRNSALCCRMLFFKSRSCAQT